MRAKFSIYCCAMRSIFAATKDRFFCRMDCAHVHYVQFMVCPCRGGLRGGGGAQGGPHPAGDHLRLCPTLTRCQPLAVRSNTYPARASSLAYRFSSPALPQPPHVFLKTKQRLTIQPPIRLCHCEGFKAEAISSFSFDLSVRPRPETTEFLISFQ